jgi:hypothetical protein
VNAAYDAAWTDERESPRRMTMIRRSTLAVMTTAALALGLAACRIPSPAQGGGGTGAAVPSGTVVAYFGADVPAGWVLCDGKVTPNGRRTPDLRNRFVMGLDPESGSALGEAGGAASHTHSAETSKPREDDEDLESGDDEHAANDGHTHKVKVEPADHLPPFVKLVYIMKD